MVDLQIKNRLNVSYSTPRGTPISSLITTINHEKAFLEKLVGFVDSENKNEFVRFAKENMFLLEVVSDFSNEMNYSRSSLKFGNFFLKLKGFHATPSNVFNHVNAINEIVDLVEGKVVSNTFDIDYGSIPLTLSLDKPYSFETKIKLSDKFKEGVFYKDKNASGFIVKTYFNNEGSKFSLMNLNRTDLDYTDLIYCNPIILHREVIQNMAKDTANKYPNLFSLCDDSNSVLVKFLEYNSYSFLTKD